MSKEEIEFTGAREAWSRTLSAANSASSDVEDNVGPAVTDAECMDIIVRDVSTRRVLGLLLDGVDPHTASAAVDMGVACTISYRNCVIVAAMGSYVVTIGTIIDRITESKMRPSISKGAIKDCVSKMEKSEILHMEPGTDVYKTTVYGLTCDGIDMVIDEVPNVEIVEVMPATVKSVIAERRLGRIIREISENDARLNELSSEMRRMQAMSRDA